MTTLSDNETARLATLYEYQILDTEAEREYDDISHLASQICGTPIAFVSLVDENRQWFKSKVGASVDELPRDGAFCAQTILQADELLIVPDARKDARFADSPLVTGDFNVRFYAGAPLVAPNGQALGSLCVVDNRPHNLNEEQQRALQTLARQVMTQMLLRKQLLQTSNQLQERKVIETALRTSEKRFQTFMNNSPAIAFIKDADGYFTYVNEPLLRRFNLEESEILGKSDKDLWPLAADELREHDLDVLRNDKTVTLTESVPMENGETTYWLSFKFPLQSEGRIFLAGMAIDITKSKRYEHQMEEYQLKLEELVSKLEAQSNSDSLTGLLNRRALDQKLEEEFARARRYDVPLSMLMIDVDSFKAFNDKFGHIAGDETLQGVASALKEKARTSDLVARYGGEEFAIVLPNTGSEGALVLAERFRRFIQERKWEHRTITISVGVASLTPEITNCDQLTNAADKALYEAKAKGRNRVERA